MKALVVEELTGATGAVVREVAAPAREQGPVLVAVQAAGLGFVDTLLARGSYQVRLAPPFVPGLEFAGVVQEAPSDAPVLVGQKVVGHVMGGACAELVRADPALVAPLPPQLTMGEGAASVVNHHTALVALQRRARLQAGERVLVHGGGGGLGSAMIQIATVLGARVSAVASTPARRDLAARAGAEHVLTPQEWFAAVRGDGGADVIIDPVGGEVFEASVRCLAPEGRLVTVGFTSGTIPRAAANRLLLRNASVVGAAWRELLTLHPCLFADTAARLADLVRAGLRPLIGVRYPLTDGPAALAGIQTRDVVGKVVLDLE